MANVIKGKDFMLYVLADNEPVPVCYARDCVLNLSHELVEKTTKQNNKFRNYGYRRATYTISLNGLLNAVDGNGSYFQDALLNGDTIFWTFSDGINFEWNGEVLVTSAGFNSAYDALAEFNNELQGNGEPEKIVLPTANTDPDQSGSEGTPTVTEYVTIKDQDGVTIAKVPAPGIFNVVRFTEIWDDLSNSNQIIIVDEI